MTRFCLWCNKPFEPKLVTPNGKRRKLATLSSFCSFSHRSFYQWRKGSLRKSQKRILITKEELEDRVKNKLQTIGQIAKELNVSYDTMHRRVIELGLYEEWSHSQTLRVSIARDKVAFVIQITPELAQNVKNEILRLMSLEPSAIVRVCYPHETWREMRSDLNGEVDYKTQRERLEALQRIAASNSSAPWDER